MNNTIIFCMTCYTPLEDKMTFCPSCGAGKELECFTCIDLGRVILKLEQENASLRMHNDRLRSILSNCESLMEKAGICYD